MIINILITLAAAISGLLFAPMAHAQSDNDATTDIDEIFSLHAHQNTQPEAFA